MGQEDPPQPVPPPLRYKAVLLASTSNTLCFSILAPTPDHLHLL